MAKRVPGSARYGTPSNAARESPWKRRKSMPRSEASMMPYGAFTKAKAGGRVIGCRDFRIASATASVWTATSPPIWCTAMQPRCRPGCVFRMNPESIFPVNSAFDWKTVGSWAPQRRSCSRPWRNRWNSPSRTAEKKPMYIALLSLCAWLYLLLAHGAFWRSRPELLPAVPPEFPDVDIIVPARNEADTIGVAIGSLLAQDYRGTFRIILVDDNSTDATSASAGAAPNLQLIRLDSKPPGWSGKLWALSRGVEGSRAPIVLFTDAD